MATITLVVSTSGVHVDNLFTLLGEVRGVVGVYAKAPRPSPTTERRYRVAFASWLAGGAAPEDAPDLDRAVWLRAAIRFGAVGRLAVLAGELDRALEAGDGDAAGIAAGEARRCLGALDRYAAGAPGRRRRRFTGDAMVAAG